MIVLASFLVLILVWFAVGSVGSDSMMLRFVSLVSSSSLIGLLFICFGLVPCLHLISLQIKGSSVVINLVSGDAVCSSPGSELASLFVVVFVFYHPLPLRVVLVRSSSDLWFCNDF